MTLEVVYADELAHFGIPGMKWGIRRFQNPDGTLTALGKERYGTVKNFETHREIVKQRNKKILKAAAITAGAAAVAAVATYAINPEIVKRGLQALGLSNGFHQVHTPKPAMPITINAAGQLIEVPSHHVRPGANSLSVLNNVNGKPQSLKSRLPAWLHKLYAVMGFTESDLAADTAANYHTVGVLPSTFDPILHAPAHLGAAFSGGKPQQLIDVLVSNLSPEQYQQLVNTPLSEIPYNIFKPVTNSLQFIYSGIGSAASSMTR